MRAVEGGEQPAVICRYCKRPIAVAASTCPWCHRQIMVICAECKSYTDDQLATCQHCGAPLRPDSMESVTRLTGDPVVAELARDSERAQVVASALVVGDLPRFIYTNKDGRASALAELLGSNLDHQTAAVAVIVAAYAFLVERGYTRMRWDPSAQRTWIEVQRPWDGQHNCLESALHSSAALLGSTYEASERTLTDLMGFRAALTPVRAADGRLLTRVPERSPVAALHQLVRLTVLPPHDARASCQEIEDMLDAWVRAQPAQARELVLETQRLLDWLGAQVPATGDR